MKKRLLLLVLFFVSISFVIYAQQIKTPNTSGLKYDMIKKYHNESQVTKQQEMQNHLNDLRFKQEQKEHELHLDLQKAHKNTKSNPKVKANEQDSLALVAFYNSTNGDSWSENTNWLTGELNTWYGITINDSGYVTEIILQYNNLTGTIPAEIGNLTNLTSLNLTYNQLGIIPAEIGNLTNLQYLSLNSNGLGTIPAEIWNLNNLRYLALNSNGLSGTIPAGIWNLTNLQYLDLRNNQLSGTIPAGIGNLTNLQSLYLDYNQLTGVIPAEIWNLTNLGTLSLSINKLTGTIPAEIDNLTNLTNLCLDHNQLTGTIPAEIGNLTNLTSLYLDCNQLTGTIPAEIGNLTNLTNLWLDYNQLSGIIPAEIGNLTNLTNLSLCNNQLVDLPDLSSLTNLDYLKIQNNLFTFEDIEPNIGVASNFDYSSQAKVGEEEFHFLNSGDKDTILVSVGGEHNTYQWYKDDVYISGAIDTAYIISNFVAANDTGTYYCKINNTVASDLTLESEPTHVYEKTYHTVTFNISDGTNAIEGATVSLTGYGNLTTNASGVAIFNNVVPENNIVYTVTATGCKNVIDSINVINSNVTENVTMVLITYLSVTFNVTDGTNAIEGATISLTGYGDLTTSASGEVIFSNVVPENNIVYTVTSTGYNNVTDSINVINNDVTENVTMIVTSIDEISGINVKIYPNPSTGLITFYSNFKLNSKIEILDVTGQIVHSVNITSENQQIDLRNLTKGVYFIKVRSDKYFKTEKLIIE